MQTPEEATMQKLVDDAVADSLARLEQMQKQGWAGKARESLIIRMNESSRGIL